jgi:hypothetical protein
VSKQKKRTKRLRGTCIYCGVDGAIRSREHVIPQALGLFENNWTLDCVCAGCNSYFARELELALGRDSLEAYSRLVLGLRPPSDAAKLLNRRTKMQVVQEGFYKGAWVELGPSADGSELVPILQPQVGFRLSDDDEWVWILADVLSAETLAPYSEGKFQARLACDAQLGPIDSLVEKLATFGIPFQKLGEYTDPLTGDGTTVDIEHEFIVDVILQRAGAKIGFNYAAKVLGAEVVRRPAFDQTRRFVRVGDVAAGNPVRVSRAQVLAGDSQERTLTRGHLCSVAWLPDKRILAALVRPFNEVTYGIALAREDPSVVGVRSGHLFDPFDHSITEVQVPDLQ